MAYPREPRHQRILASPRFSGGVFRNPSGATPRLERGASKVVSEYLFGGQRRVPKAPLPLIQDGIAQRVVHDTRSAARAGTGAATTGHALAPGGHADGPIPTNLVLHGGGASDERELAADVRRGIYVTRLWYLNAVDEREVLLTGTSRDGTFLIEDGEVTRPLRDVRFTDSALRLLGATQALTAQPRLVCEGEFYGRRFATGVVCPGLRAEGFRVTGSTPAR